MFNNGSEEPAKINFSTDDHCKSLLCAASLCWDILELVKVFIAKDLEVKNENINYWVMQKVAVFFFEAFQRLMPLGFY